MVRSRRATARGRRRPCAAPPARAATRRTTPGPAGRAAGAVRDPAPHGELGALDRTERGLALGRDGELGRHAHRQLAERRRQLLRQRRLVPEAGRRHDRHGHDGRRRAELAPGRAHRHAVLVVREGLDRLAEPHIRQRGRHRRRQRLVAGAEPPVHAGAGRERPFPVGDPQGDGLEVGRARALAAASAAFAAAPPFPVRRSGMRRARSSRPPRDRSWPGARSPARGAPPGRRSRPRRDPGLAELVVDAGVDGRDAEPLGEPQHGPVARHDPLGAELGHRTVRELHGPHPAADPVASLQHRHGHPASCKARPADRPARPAPTTTTPRDVSMVGQPIGPSGRPRRGYVLRVTGGRTCGLIGRLWYSPHVELNGRSSVRGANREKDRGGRHAATPT